MTRAQAEEVLAIGRAEIREWVRKLTPIAGQNAVVENGAVSFTKLPAATVVAPPVQTWQVYFFGSVLGAITSSGDPVEIDVQDELAGRVVRSTLGLVTTSFWSAHTQLLDTPREEDEVNLQRSYRLTLKARAIPAGQAVAVDSGWTPPNLRVTLEEYDSSSDPTAGEVLDTHVLILRSGEASASFTQRNPGRITSLRPVAVERI
jgi:hypothetical protein